MTWQTKTLGDLTKLIKDGTHGSHKDVKNGIPLLSAKDINSGKIHITSDARRISQDDFDAIHKNYQLKDGDVLLTIVGTLGRIAVIRNYKSNYTLQRSVSILRFKDFVSPYFVQYVLYSENFQKDLLRRESKGAQGGVYLGDIAKIKISIPDLAEQERIVGVLEAWDNYLEKLERKIQIEEALLKQILKSVLLNKEREFCRLDGRVFVKKGKALLSSQVVKGKYPVIAGGKSSPYYHNKYTDENVVTVSASGANAGFVSYHPEKIWASDCSVVYGDGENSTTEYLYYALKAVQNNIYHHQSGGAQPHVYPKDILAQKIWLPSIGEQKKIASVFTDLDMKINILKSKKYQIQQQKKFLLKKLVSGIIRTPEDILEKGVN